MYDSIQIMNFIFECTEVILIEFFVNLVIVTFTSSHGNRLKTNFNFEKLATVLGKK